MAMRGRDLFSALRVSAGTGSPSDLTTADGNDTVTNASRIDIGWAAWRACSPPAQATELQRWEFRLSLWQHFGRAKFLVQVDDSYHTATSLRIRHLPDSGNMDILLIQTASIWQCLRGFWQHRSGQPTPAWRKHLTGRNVHVSRYPETLNSASLPAVSQLGYAPCAEVLLDGQHASQLPLHISSSH